MIFSQEQMFSDGQALTGTAASTNIIDLGATGTVLNGPAALVRDIGKGERIPIWIQLDVAAGGTSPTLTVEIQVDDNASFSSATTVATTDTISGGTAGQRVPLFYVPQGANERFMRLNYTLTGTSPTYTITAGIVLAAQDLPAVAGV